MALIKYVSYLSHFLSIYIYNRQYHMFNRVILYLLIVCVLIVSSFNKKTKEVYINQISFFMNKIKGESS